MLSPDFQLTVLGTRGSIAMSGADYREYGGSTSCYMVQAGEDTLFLDAGSGLLSAPGSYPKAPVILLSHLHLDHVFGLGLSPLLTQKEQQIDLYIPFCETEETARRQLDRIYSPPFWPVRLEELGAELRLRCVPARFSVGRIRVETMTGQHPGGCMVYKLSCAGKTIVFATDYEHGGESDARLAAFAQNADLLLYDAQFAPEEYERKKGYGHSTAEKGLELMERSHAGQLLLIHHDFKSTDRILLERENKLGTERASYAREGQTIIL